MSEGHQKWKKIKHIKVDEDKIQGFQAMRKNENVYMPSSQSYTDVTIFPPFSWNKEIPIISKTINETRK